METSFRGIFRKTKNMKIKKGDQIMVIAGKDNGKKGNVLKAMPSKGKIVVSGINMAKHHLKPSKKTPHGGIIDMPAAFDVSSAMLVCPHCGKPTRVAYKVSATTKERVCRKCQGNLDVNSADKKVKEKNVKA